MFRCEMSGHHESQEISLNIFPPQVTAGESAVAQLDPVDPSLDPARRRGSPWSLVCDDRQLGASDRYDRGITFRFNEAGKKHLLATTNRLGPDRVVLAQGEVIVHGQVESELDFIVNNLDQFGARGWFRSILERHRDDAYRKALDLALGHHLESPRASIRETAFTLLVMMHEPSWRRVAARFLGRDEHAINDVVQETKRRTWRSLPQFRAGVRFGPWAHKTVLHACQDAKTGTLLTTGDIDPQTKSTDEAIEAIDVRDALDRLTRHLDPSDVKLLTLRYGHDMAFIDIARALNIQPDSPDPTRVSTVRRHVERLTLALKTGQAPSEDAHDRGGIA
jgi:RNA polymerase sigma factor (sigma-70 family)